MCDPPIPELFSQGPTECHCESVRAEGSSYGTARRATYWPEEADGCGWPKRKGGDSWQAELSGHPQGFSLLWLPPSPILRRSRQGSQAWWRGARELFGKPRCLPCKLLRLAPYTISWVRMSPWSPRTDGMPEMQDSPKPFLPGARQRSPTVPGPFGGIWKSSQDWRSIGGGKGRGHSCEIAQEGLLP